MELVVDTSVIIAVLTSEPERGILVQATRGADLVAPASVHWEVGNTLGAMLKRDRITLAQALQAVAAYQQIPIRFMEIDLETALQLAAEHDLHAYDAYVIACASRQRCGLLALDHGLLRAAKAAGVRVVEVGK